MVVGIGSFENQSEAELETESSLCISRACAQLEYVTLIRSEIEGIKDRVDHETITQLPILDSFFKESYGSIR